MAKPFLFGTLALILITIYAALLPTERPYLRWAVYYGELLPARTFRGLDLVIFDRERHPDIRPLKGRTLTFAYISIGEVWDGEHEAAEKKGSKLLISKNKVWKSHVVDITDPAWTDIVLAKVEDAKSKGFDGVMLDTIDSPLYLAAESRDNKRLKAVEDAAVALIHQIRKHYPQTKIILNRGFSILPRVAGEIDYVLAESIFAKTDVSTGQFGLFPPMTYAGVAEQLQGVAAENPRLQILTLDYWNTQDVKGLERIYTTQRARGFSPYVTLPDLQSFTPTY